MKRSFIISGLLMILAGLAASFAWVNYMKSFSIITMVIAVVLFITSVVIFAINFRE